MIITETINDILNLDKEVEITITKEDDCLWLFIGERTDPVAIIDLVEGIVRIGIYSSYDPDTEPEIYTLENLNLKTK